jgi:putative ABC transport system substrate-binding protein
MLAIAVGDGWYADGRKMDAGYRVTRRTFVQGAAVTGAGLLAGCGRLPWQTAPAERAHRIGLLLSYAAGSTQSMEVIEPFRAGLHDWGYVEGQNVFVEYRYSGGQNDRLPVLATELIQLPVDVLVTEKHDAILAAKQATSSIPIVMSVSADPVGTGYVASLARPGGNITGMSSMAPHLSAKRLELLQQMSPAVSRVAIFHDPTYPVAQRLAAEAQVGAQALGLELLVFDVRTPGDFEPAFEAAVRKRADGLYVFGDPLNLSQRSRLIDFAAQQGLPAVYLDKPWATLGGLMAYGPDYSALHRRAGYYVDRILKGAKPADLPIEQPTIFEFVINLKAAQALGLTIPQHVLLQATVVLQ